MADERVIWQPLPGSQTLAMSCPANIILYTGGRGAGKTDCQLLRFRARVGQGYGRHWRGVIFDREYKNLDDLVSKSQRWFPEFYDGARFINSKSDYKWVWKTGEELLFRTIKKESDYWNFHGQEFCLESSSMICTPNGDVPIKNIKVGDYVLTAVGPRKVTKVFPEKQKPCVQATVFDKSGNIIGQSKFSESHKVLSSDLKLWTQHCDGNRSVFLFVLLKILQKAWIRRVLCFRLKSLVVFFECLLSILKTGTLAYYNQHRVFSKFHELSSQCYNLLSIIPFLNPKNLSGDEKIQSCDQNDGKECYNQPLIFSRLRKYHVFRLNLKFPFHLKIYQYRLQISKKLQVLYKFFELEKMNMIICYKGYLDRHVSLKFLLQKIYFVMVNEPLSNVLGYLGTIRGYLNYCYLYCNQYDAQLRVEVSTVRGISLLNADDIRRTHADSQMGDQVYGLENNHSYHDSLRCNYIHPYTHEYNRAILPFQEGKLLSVPCGILNTIDIEVEGSNSYIIPSNLLSCNCYIGWNELTKYPDLKLFDAMASCNRSSFRPEDYPYWIDGDIYKKSGNIKFVHSKHKKALIQYLPEIPLETFATCNPYGPGHNAIKKRFIDVAPMGKIHKTVVNVFNPKTQKREDITKTQVHIFGSYMENKYLSPEYIVSLETITDPNKRKAWLMGSWDVVSGGMFDDVWDRTYNVVTSFDIPNSWRIDRSFDWGSSKPFSVGWWAESDGSDVVMKDGSIRHTIRGDLFRIYEWYGCVEGATNEGLRMLGEDIAKGIIERELKWGIYDKVNLGPADNSIFDVENGNSIAASMRKSVRINNIEYPGVEWIRSDKSPGSRIAGWEKMRLYLKQAAPQYRDYEIRNSLRVPILESIEPREQPGLFAFDRCIDFISQIPTLPRDEKNPDDVESSSEDHIADETRYKLLSIGVGAKSGKTTGTQ